MAYEMGFISIVGSFGRSWNIHFPLGLRRKLHMSFSYQQALNVLDGNQGYGKNHYLNWFFHCHVEYD
jgi:hypothetical protein